MKPFIEKYRPQEMKDVIGLEWNIPIDQNLPHLLFYGIQGSGKTSAAKIIIRKLGADALVLNASSDRGIDIIRNQVKSFASTKSMDNKVKIVFLDEADKLTDDAQTALRTMMEDYIGNCRFILTCNSVNKIIDPIRSRCVQVQFGGIKEEDVVGRLKYICQNEGINFEEDALRKIAHVFSGDVRSAVNKIQELRVTGVLLDALKFEDSVAKKVFDALVVSGFEEARQIYLDSRVVDEQFIMDFFREVNRLTGEARNVGIHAVAMASRNLKNVAWKQIEIEDMLLTISEAL